MAIDPTVATFPEEMAIIGRLLSGYTEIELSLAHCAVAAGNDFDTVTKVLYRLRGETSRIDAADAFARQLFDVAGIGTEFSMCVGYVRRCMSIRNQYAHCHWWSMDMKSLGFANMEEVAILNTRITDLRGLTYHALTLDLLKLQEEFFRATELWALYLNYEIRLRTGKVNLNPYPKPKPLKMPELYIP